MSSFDLPEIDLRHFLQLTDDTGMLQHAAYLTPDLDHGYCTDDNARALIAAVYHARFRGYDERTVPLQRYLSFLAHAYNRCTGRFRNFMSYDRRWLEDIGSEDSHARAIWSTGRNRSPRAERSHPSPRGPASPPGASCAGKLRAHSPVGVP